MKNKELFVIMPRMSSKRLSTLLFAKQKAKEGYTVTVHDIGSSDDIVFKPDENKQNNDILDDGKVR